MRARYVCYDCPYVCMLPSAAEDHSRRYRHLVSENPERSVRVKCTICGYTTNYTDILTHALDTQHYSFRFTRDVEIPAMVRERAVH